MPANTQFMFRFSQLTQSWHLLAIGIFSKHVSLVFLSLGVYLEPKRYWLFEETRPFILQSISLLEFSDCFLKFHLICFFIPEFPITVSEV